MFLLSRGEILEKDRNAPLELFQQWQGYLPHLGMRLFAAALLEKVPPLPHIVGDDYFRLERVGQNVPGFLRRTAEFIDERQISPFIEQHSHQPDIEFVHGNAFVFPDGKPFLAPFPDRRNVDAFALRILCKEKGIYDRDLRTELAFRIIAVAGRLLGIGTDAVPHDFMRHSAVADHPDGDLLVLDYAFVSVGKDPGPDEFGVRIIRDLVFALVTQPAVILDLFQNSFKIIIVLDHKARAYYVHFLPPPG